MEREAELEWSTVRIARDFSILRDLRAHLQLRNHPTLDNVRFTVLHCKML